MDNVIRSEVRALQKVGGSLAVYLPREWCDMNKLEKGSKVNIRYTNDFLCIDIDKPSEIKGASIDVSSLLESDLKYILISLYILGYDHVKLTFGRRISLPLRRYVISSLRYTPEYRVVDEGDNFITLKRVAEGGDLIKALRHEFNSVLTMFRYVLESLQDGKDLISYVDAIEELDDEVDRARVEVERAAYKLTERPYLNVSMIRYVIPSVMISKYLERIADHLVSLMDEIGKITNSINKEVMLELLRELNVKYDELKKLFEEYYFSEIHLKKGDIISIVSKLIYIIENKKGFKDAILSRVSTSHSGLLSYHIIRIYDYFTDIAEALINALIDRTMSA